MNSSNLLGRTALKVDIPRQQWEARCWEHVEEKKSVANFRDDFATDPRHAQGHETRLQPPIDFQNGPAYPESPFKGTNDDSGVHAAATSATHGPSSASSRHFTSLRQSSHTISVICQCRWGERRRWMPRPASLNRATAHSGYSKGAQSHLPRLLCSTSTLHTTHSRLHHLTPTFSYVVSLIETL